ncbi:PAS domain S-box-containing protein/diguanylate cyclase (GGDEF) domain-containing protein [Ectothiorhodospira magna]|uniref:PAS domain S-box-containing protein/diguanylate cyclase (GGDEF) domain-containing protein n=1 Tax=Ectothiorhodospira magna TaxID=867345 RepID=A0A1H9BXD9_9GAMM|nr:bifunctional diguanylate cyclase/phosphodiesterase [Ectothiorhodospira magna]SEP93635.1 PAS domain S-box-containing protein/diguanylate cyclase (GGDEF) domain-containing protein [Ectothiorhodospira magna]
MALKQSMLSSSALRERARQILKDRSFENTLFSLKQGELDMETLLEELHIYHAELRIQQEALLDSQEATELALSRFSRLYQELPLPVLRIDWSGFLQDANTAAHRLLALNRRLFTQLSEAKHRSFLENALERARHDGRADCQGVRLRRADGRPLIADVALIRIPEPDGAQPGFICSVVDQTLPIQQRDALLESYARLQDSEDNYRILADFSPDWDFWTGPDGELRYISPACERISGYRAEAFMEDPALMEQIIHTDDLARYRDHKASCGQAAGTTLPTPLRLRILTRSGDIRWIEHICNPVIDSHGRFMGHRGINRDVSEAQQAHQALEDQLRFQAMLADISSLFVNVHMDHLGLAMVQALEQIGRFFGMARGRILEFCPDQTCLALTHLWSTPDPDQRDATMTDTVPVTQLPWTTHRMRAREILTLERGPGQPPELAREHQLLSPDHPVLTRLVPMASNGDLLGVLVLDAWSGETRDHDPDLPARMRVVAEHLVSLMIRCRVQKELQDSEARYRHVCAVTNDIAYSCRRDEQGQFKLEWITDSIQAVTGYSAMEIHAQGCWGFLVLEEDQDTFRQEILNLEPGRASRCELRLRCKLGSPRWVMATTECLLPSTTSSGQIQLYGGLVDITDRKALSDQLSYLAHYDPLTGLPKRAVMRESIRQAMGVAQRKADHLALLSIDVDDLKRVNDSLGHGAGDELLKTLADRLQTLIGPDDALARLGGDHFVILATHLARTQDAVQLAERIHQAMETPLIIQDQNLVITTSTGIALFPDDADSVDELLRRADAALYRCKADGGHAYCFFTASMNKQLRENFQMEQALRRGLGRDNELLLHYQPRVDMHTGQILSLEALARWVHPDLGLLPPARFIPIAESSGLILNLGPLVLRQVCQQILHWREAGITPVPVAINLTTQELYKHNLVQDIQKTLDTFQIDPGLLEFEITESTAMRSMEDAIAILARMRAAGFKLSLDDFGTGYASMSYLSHLPVHGIKIDQSFITNLDQDNEHCGQAATIVKAMIGLGLNLDLEVVAEGVETLHQQQFLLDHQCVRGQGFLFSHPRPPEDIEPLLHTSARLLPQAEQQDQQRP